MEAKALTRNIRSSPRKMRLVIDLIRGKNANEALSILKFTQNHASIDAERTLRSAVSNLMNKDENGKVDADRIYVKEAFVNQGITMKRMLPAPQGRAYRMRKRSNHITIIVSSK
ncbi:MAG: 50S ribosomal protein L22 [Chlorobiota bacterium]|nr:50S ribosomal protein L22 [Chlorobiota bacterium]QQS65768.1 MAG: 50S ribosomal protein L22 [Chlorobiota bacterium]